MHYTTDMDKNDMPYKQAVLALVVDDENRFLIVQLNEFADDEWKFISGGLNEGEELEDGLYRELKEELGLGKDSFELVGKSDRTHKYDFPEENGKLIDGVNYRGQEKHQFLLKFVGDKNKIKLLKKEIKAIKWVKFSELRSHLKFPDQFENAKNLVLEFNIKTD